jgi:flagellar protein FlaF
MNSAAQAYARTAQTTAAPRELEAQLLLRAAARLQAIENGAVTDEGDVLSAIRYNRKLWLLLFGSMADPANPLDSGIKQNVANLATFVIKQSMALETGAALNRLGVLVSINREVAAGLRGA